MHGSCLVVHCAYNACALGRQTPRMVCATLLRRSGNRSRLWPPAMCRPRSVSLAYCREPCALRPSTDSESERRDGRLACSQGVSTVHHPNGDLDTRHDVPSCRQGRPEAGDDSDRRGRSDHPWHEPVHDEPARSSHRPSSGGDPGRSSSGPRNLCARDPPPDRRTVPPRRCRRGCPQRVSSIVGAVPSSCVFAVRRASLTPEGS